MRSSRTESKGHSLIVLAVVVGLAIVDVTPAPAEELAIKEGALEYHEESATFVEQFELPQRLADALVAAGPGGGVTVDAFPVEPGVRQQMLLTRYDVYAPEAQIIVVDEMGEREVPRSTRIFFSGRSLVDEETRVGISVDPANGTFRGVVVGAGGVYVIGEPDTATPGLHVIASSQALAPPGAAKLEIMCGADELPLELSEAELHPLNPGVPAAKGIDADPQYSAVIAFDSDQEWLHLRFSNDTADATTWIADYIAASNVMYERDLSLRLFVGTTYLRTGSPPYTGDPYSVSSSPANQSMLVEFGNYWESNYGAVDRVLAQLLSGKSAAENQSSGIAWIDGYCETEGSGGGGYSVFEPFKATWVGMDSNVRVGAHELGHNFGSPHTHCYSPPVDTCFKAEAGCWSGAVSCPPGGSGTMMSYCHFGAPNGAGCGSNLIEFHPTVMSYLDGYRASHTPWCIELLDGHIFSDGFESGSTNAWD